jgi:Flp pilus assembly protein TadD
MDVRSPAPLDRPTGASVSVSQLGHKIPRAALKSYTRANQFSKKGEPARAAAELEGAIGLDPQFAEAYTNLGVAYGQLGRFDEATAALRRSLELDPHSSMAHYNMGIVLYKIGDIAGAVQSARRAVAESSENAWAHLLLGGLLSGKEATRTEGLQHIEVAARSLPLAREFIRSFTPPQ